MMSKYDRLRRFLREANNDIITLSFRFIEETIGVDLPESAYKYREWWANDVTHTQALNGWLAAGYEVASVNLDRGIVTFVHVPRRIVERLTEEQIENLGVEPGDIKITPKEFEERAREIMSRNFGTPLHKYRAPGWPKEFDLVSKNLRIVGDAKYFIMVRGRDMPPAKFATIAEHVWFLEKIDAEIKFLVFGNDIRVPLEWLKRYGSFVEEVRFYFIDEKGNVKRLK